GRGLRGRESRPRREAHHRKRFDRRSDRLEVRLGLPGPAADPTGIQPEPRWASPEVRGPKDAEIGIRPIAPPSANPSRSSLSLVDQNLTPDGLDQPSERITSTVCAAAPRGVRTAFANSAAMS